MTEAAPPGVWRTALQEFDLLVDLDAPALATRLSALAASDPALHAAVTRLLDASTTAEKRAFLEEDDATTPGLIAPGAAIGPFRLVSRIGRGGMGEVWRAHREDGLTAAPVALKLLHAHLAHSVLRGRFVREGRILGQLTHPHIARLLDAGITAGNQPYLAIEYVEGERIDAWCDRHRLDLAARVRLFLQVCDAVAQAHAHLVVHRDLKPSNILVDEEGRVKLLDFGIAKLVEDDGTGTAETEMTRLGGRVLTPEYAAPEQLSGLPITTAADVYSLGVLLYLLLSGRRPHGDGGPDTGRLEREVLDTDPAPLGAARPRTGAPAAANISHLRGTTPGSLRRALRGDLDTIVRRALKKEPAQRYVSVLAFAEDLGRWLGNRPVLARPDSLGYRARMYVRRHRIGVAAAAAVVLAVAAGVAGVLWQARLAVAAGQSERRQREIAETRAAELRRLVDFQGAMLQRVNLPGFGADFARRMQERLQLRAGQGEAASLPAADEIGRLFDRLKPYAGLTDVARDTIAADLLAPARAELGQRFSGQPALQAELLDSLAGSYAAVQAHAEAESLYAEAARLHADAGEPLRALDSREQHAFTLSRLGREAEALQEGQAVIAERRNRLGEGHPDTMRVESMVATLLRRLHRLGEAEPLARSALARQQAVLGPEHPDALTTQSALCAIFVAEEKTGEGLRCLTDAVPPMMRVFGPLDYRTTAARDNLATAQIDAGHYAEARDLLVPLIEEERAAFGEDANGVLVAELNLANALADLGDRAGAMRIERDLIDARLRLYGPDDRDVLRAQSNYAADVRDSGDLRGARRLLENVLERRRRQLGPDDPDTLRTTNNLAVVLRLQGDLKGARALAETALAGFEKQLGSEHPYTLEALDEAAEAAFGEGDVHHALDLGERALAGYRKVLGDAHGDTQSAMEHVIAYRRASGDAAGAQALSAELAVLRAKAPPPA